MPEVMERRHAGMIGERPVNNVVRDVYDWICKTFIQEPKNDTIILDEAAFVEWMGMAFGKKYNPEMIAKLLANGFKRKDGNFLFKRDDFIRPLKNRLEATP